MARTLNTDHPTILTKIDGHGRGPPVQQCENTQSTNTHLEDSDFQLALKSSAHKNITVAQSAQQSSTTYCIQISLANSQCSHLWVTNTFWWYMITTVTAS